MKKYFIITGTVTYAMMGRDVLQKYGYTAWPRRAQHKAPDMGCGWGIWVQADPAAAVELLKKQGVKVLGVVSEDDLLG